MIGRVLKLLSDEVIPCGGKYGFPMLEEILPRQDASCPELALCFLAYALNVYERVFKQMDPAFQRPFPGSLESGRKRPRLPRLDLIKYLFARTP